MTFPPHQHTGITDRLRKLESQMSEMRRIAFIAGGHHGEVLKLQERLAELEKRVADLEKEKR